MKTFGLIDAIAQLASLQAPKALEFRVVRVGALRAFVDTVKGEGKFILGRSVA